MQINKLLFYSAIRLGRNITAKAVSRKEYFITIHVFNGKGFAITL